MHRDEISRKYKAGLDEHLLRATDLAFDFNLKKQFIDLAINCMMALLTGHKIIFFGNGGSAADAQHIATELASSYLYKNRDPFNAIALTTNTSLLTAIGNDFAFEDIFSRQITACGKPGDVAIGISTSGNSANVIQGVRRAAAMGLVPAALGGSGGGQLKAIATPYLVVPSNSVPRIQEMHILLGHLLCEVIEAEIGIEKPV